MNNEELTIEEMIALGMLNANAVAQPAVAVAPNARQEAINAKIAQAMAKYSDMQNEFGAEANIITANEPRGTQAERQALNQLKRNYIAFKAQEERNSRIATQQGISNGLYNEARGVLMSENKESARDKVMRVAALDDVLANERIRLNFTNSNATRRNIASRIYNLEQLKADIDQKRHSNENLNNNIKARYNTLVGNVDFSALPYSITTRLEGNRKSGAATRIQSKFRGFKTRKQYKPELNALKAARLAEREAELVRLAQEQGNSMVPMVNFGAKPKNEGRVLGGPGAVAAVVQANEDPVARRRRLAAERAAAFNKLKKANKGGRRTHKKAKKAKRSRKN
jgi:hypothetical protein